MENEKFELIAKTFQGLETILAEELTNLGADNIQIGRRMVSFTGDKEMMYKANFCLRTAIRILPCCSYRQIALQNSKGFVPVLPISSEFTFQSAPKQVYKLLISCCLTSIL